MIKRLPCLKSSQNGFTLIELLVVITIIAILSVVATTSYFGLQKNARNTQRVSELDSISKALEVNKDYAGYNPLTANEFSNHKLPGQDSSSGVYALDPKKIPYCISIVPDVLDADPASWSASSDPETVGGICPVNPPLSDYQPLDDTAPLSGDKQWKVCTLLETEPPTVKCLSSAQ